MLLTIIRKKQGETASTKKETEKKKKEKWILMVDSYDCFLIFFVFLTKAKQNRLLQIIAEVPV